MDQEEKQEQAFREYISLCEETCRHDCGNSDERLILEYLERVYGVSSDRYEWAFDPTKP
jgi:hypothetical protein